MNHAIWAKLAGLHSYVHHGCVGRRMAGDGRKTTDNGSTRRRSMTCVGARGARRSSSRRARRRVVEQVCHGNRRRRGLAGSSRGRPNLGLIVSSSEITDRSWAGGRTAARARARRRHRRRRRRRRCRTRRGMSRRPRAVGGRGGGLARRARRAALSGGAPRPRTWPAATPFALALARASSAARRRHGEKSGDRGI